MSANASIGYCGRCNSWILWRCVDTQSDLELRGEWPLILNGNFEFAKADGDTKRAFNGTNAHHVDLEGQNPKWTSRASSKSSGRSRLCFVPSEPLFHLEREGRRKDGCQPLELGVPTRLRV